jgi:hypothetical protein
MAMMAMTVSSSTSVKAFGQRKTPSARLQLPVVNDKPVVENFRVIGFIGNVYRF